MDHSVLARFGMKLWKGRVCAPWLHGPVMTHTPKLCFITYCLVTSNSWKASYINQHVGRRATVYFSGGARGGGRGKEKEVQNVCKQTDMKSRMQKFPVHLRLGGTEHGGKAEFSSHLQSFRCLLLSVSEHVFVALTDLHAELRHSSCSHRRNACRSVWSTTTTICRHAWINTHILTVTVSWNDSGVILALFELI